MLLNSGFKDIRRTNIAKSKVKQFNKFDNGPPREKLSIYIEAIK